MAEPPVTFAGLLRQLRTGAGLTQEELAEAASVSVRSVRDLERGKVATPQKEAVRLLADALRLTGRPGPGSRRSPEATRRGAGWRRRRGRCRVTSPRSLGGSGSWPS